MPVLNVQTVEGEQKQIEAKTGAVLMESLRDAGIIEATCGGAASCGTCHVYFTGDWASKPGTQTEDEGYMLESLGDFVEIKPGSRLACQVKVTDDHDGAHLDIAPEVE